MLDVRCMCPEVLKAAAHSFLPGELRNTAATFIKLVRRLSLQSAHGVKSDVIMTLIGYHPGQVMALNHESDILSLLL